MNLDLRFLLKKVLASGTPKVTGHPVFLVFERNQEGVIKSFHESLDDAKSAIGFGDTIIQFNATRKIELSFSNTVLPPSE